MIARASEILPVFAQSFLSVHHLSVPFCGFPPQLSPFFQFISARKASQPADSLASAMAGDLHHGDKEAVQEVWDQEVVRT